MNSSLLSSIKSIPYLNNNTVLDYYTFFKKEIVYPKNSNHNILFGGEIYYNLRSKDEILFVADIFWHIISRENTTKYDIPGCNNITKNFNCDNNCYTHDLLTPNSKRFLCPYRLSMIHWIPEILILANNSSPHIKIWDNLHKNKRHIRRKIWFKYENVSYIIILEKFNHPKYSYKFITAFPIFYTRAKKKLLKEYKNRIKK